MTAPEMRRPGRRLAVTLAIWILPALVLTMTASLWVSSTTITELSDSAYDRSLAGAIRAIDSNISTESGGVGVELPYNLFEFFQLTAQGRVYFNVSTSDNLVQIGDVLLPEVEDLSIDQLRFVDARYLGDDVRLGALARPLDRTQPDGTSVVIQVAETKASRSAFQNALLERSIQRDLLVVVALAALLSIGVYFAVKPLRRLRDSIDQRDPDDLTPISGHAVPAEVVPLVEAINRLMQRNLRRAEQERQFLDDASHQLRTPMAVLRTQIDVALHDTDLSRVHETLRSSKGVLDRSSRTITQLLTLARARASEGTDLYPMQELDLGDAVADVIRLHWQQLRRRKMDCEYESADQPILVRANESLLREAVGNLLDNAIRYSPSGSHLEVRTFPDGVFGIVEILDQGPGMVADEIKQAGVRFRRGQASKGRSGTGLGIAIAFEAVRASAGRLELENRVDAHGLLVRLRIPLAIES